MKTVRTINSFLLSFILFLPFGFLHAQFENPLNATDLQGFLMSILSVVIALLFPIIILMIVYTGFLFVRAQGNPSKIEEARRALVWTLIGGLIVLGAYTIASTVKDTVDEITVVDSLLA